MVLSAGSCDPPPRGCAVTIRRFWKCGSTIEWKCIAYRSEADPTAQGDRRSAAGPRRVLLAIESAALAGCDARYDHCGRLRCPLRRDEDLHRLGLRRPRGGGPRGGLLVGIEEP